MKKLYLLSFILIITMLFTSCGGYGSTNKDLDLNYGGIVSESYNKITENDQSLTKEVSTVTLSLKVSTAAYSNVKRIIEQGNVPPRDAVRTEEMINYFKYEGETEKTDSPFFIHSEMGPSPFDTNKRMAFIRIKTEEIEMDKIPPCNFTFLIDTSGSMSSYDKLPLLQDSFKLLIDTLDENDTISIVTYAGNSEVLLDGVSGKNKKEIIAAIDSLEAGGSTAGAQGIQTAYSLAERNFNENGNNRIILASDGDFNVGISDVDQLKEFISEKKDSGIYLSVLGFGTGNLRDDVMETLASNGNGNHSYIDCIDTANKVLITEMSANLFTVANDVKAQIEFNKDTVKSHRLIGYENSVMENEDFKNDKKDAGEMGAGSDIVVMFELELTEAGLKNIKEPDSSQDNFYSINIAYKDPAKEGENLDDIKSKTISMDITAKNYSDEPSTDYNFACAVAGFAHILRGSLNSGDVTTKSIIELAQTNLGKDEDEYRLDFLFLVREYQKMEKSANH